MRSFKILYEQLRGCCYYKYIKILWNLYIYCWIKYVVFSGFSDEKRAVSFDTALNVSI